MADAPRIEAWVRGRFVTIPGATAHRIRANAWTVRIPRTDEAARALRIRRWTLRALDGLELSLDEQEATQTFVSAERPDAFELSVLL